ncbi:hypothetical protein [Facklamia sp. 7083-14-GEN3]|uniref:hypothetical protein n=1 Tax=Facklamia sp. 7083-14-GEN3 TaxID=2973478 RepID=UPI00215BBB0F|nr:hypothetical protein [Facklamia sp. 7083-14-GEN3]MCR8969242.1 hypothetical protein [Facklamia sp. 7083-14-GEN3]
MKKHFPLSFYFKILFIVLGFGTAYYCHEEVIDQVLSQEGLSTFQRLSKISKELIGIEKLPDEESPDIINQIQSYPGNKQPIQYPPAIVEHPRFIKSQQKADLFNDQLDISELNRSFVEEVNRAYFTQRTVFPAPYLSNGNLLRLEELNDYAYLDSKTIDGVNFRERFYGIEDNQYRIGENLYEVFISSDDIHLDTWSKDEAVFAQYLAEAFFEQTEDFYDMKRVYLSAKASATDFRLDDSSYVRIVVVLNFDTQKL